MYCPKCGTENLEQAESCIKCGENLSAKMQVNNDPKRENNEEQAFSQGTLTSDREKPVVSTGVNIAIIIGTIFFPVIGVAMGYTYMRKDHPEAKKAGKNWLILGLAMFLVNILLINSMK
jgi:uncharacterized membrane protein YvbJ